MRLIPMGAAEVLYEGEKRLLRLPGCLPDISSPADMAAMPYFHSSVIYVPKDDANAYLDRMIPPEKRGGRIGSELFRATGGRIHFMEYEHGKPLLLPDYAGSSNDKSFFCAQIEGFLALLIVCPLQKLMDIVCNLCLHTNGAIYSEVFGEIKMSISGKK